MFCTRCGIDVGANTFCHHCGTCVGAATQENQGFSQANFNQGDSNSNQDQGFNNQQTAGMGFAANPNNMNPMAKSKIVAGLLGIFLGAFGIHNFYLGFTGKAVAQLLMSTVGWILIIPPFAAGIWGFIEGIMILVGSISRDAQGVPLRD